MAEIIEGQDQTKGQEQINQQVDGGEKRKRLNFADAIFAGGNLPEIYEASLISKLEPEMPTFKEFQSKYNNVIAPEQQQQYYDQAGKMLEYYKGVDKSLLQIDAYRFPDNEYFRGDEYPKDVISKHQGRDKIILKDRYFHTPKGDKIELYSSNEEATARGFWIDKDNKRIPLSLEKYAKNPLKLQESYGGGYWVESEDNEIVSSELIRNAYGRDRTLQTGSAWSSILRGLYSGTAPIIVKGVGTGVGVIANLGDQIGSWALDYDFRPEERGYYKFNAKAQNWGNMHSTKNFDEMQSMFDDGNAALYSISNIMTQMIGMFATGFTVGTTTRLAGAGAKWSMRWGSISARLLGSVEAGSGYQELLVNEGVDFNRASQYLVPFMAETFAIESMAGGYIEKAGAKFSNKLFGNFSKVELGKIFNETLKEEIAKSGKVLREMSVEQQKSFVGKLWKKYLNKKAVIEEATYTGKKFLGGLKRSVVGAAGESFEEITEGVAHTYTSMIVNGREAVIGERYLNLNSNYNYTPINPDNPAEGFRRISKTNKNDVTELSYDEYQDHIKYTNHFNDVLAGRKTLDTSFNIAEDGVSTFAGVFLTGGFGNATGVLSPRKNKVASEYTLASSILKNPKVRKEVIATLKDMQKKGEFFDMENQDLYVDKFIAEMDFNVALLKKTKDNPNVIKALKGDESLVRQLFVVNKDIIFQKDKLSQLAALSSKLENNSLAEDNDDLGLKKGDTQEDIDNKIKEVQAVLEVNEKKAKYITEPEKKTNYVFNEKGTGKREVTEDTIYYGEPPIGKETSKAYSKMWYDAMAINYDLKQTAEKAARKELGLNENENSAKLSKLTEKYIDKGYETLALINQESNYDRFEVLRDVFLDVLKDYDTRTNKQNNENIKGLRDSVTSLGDGKTLESGVEKMISNIVQPITDLMEGIKEGESIYDDPDAIIKLRGILEVGSGTISTMKELASTINPSSETAKKVAGYLSALESIPGVLQEGITQEAKQQDIDTYLVDMDEGIRTIRGNLGKQAETQKNSYDNPTDEDKIEALKNMLYGIPEIKDGKLVRSMGETIDYLYKISQKNIAGFGMPHDAIKNNVEKYLQAVLNIQDHVNSNVDFVQGTLEATKDNLQHSTLLNNDNARFNKNIQDQWNEISEKEIEKTKFILEKIESLTASKETNNFKVESSNIIIDFQILKNFVQYNDDKYISVSKEVIDITSAGISNIEDILKKKLPNGDTAKDINDLLLNYLKSETANKKAIEELLHEIENEIIETKQKLSGKLDHVITGFNKVAGDSYTRVDPADQSEYVDRKLESLLENGGLLSVKSWADGYNLFFNKGLNSPAVKQSNQAMFFFQHTLNMLNEINKYGSEGTPTIKKALQAIKDIVAETPDGENINTYEQEKMLLTLIGFLYSPSNEFIKDGIIKSELRSFAPSSVSKVIDNVIFAKGYGGSGKSSLVVKNLIKAYYKLEGNKNKLNITMILPSSALIEDHGKNLEDLKGIANIKYELLHEVVSGKVKVSDQSIVIVDEGTLLPMSQENNIGSIISKSNSNWIFLGDDVQTTPFKDVKKRVDGSTKAEKSFFVNSERYLLSNIARFTSPLTEVHRQNFLMHSMFQDEARQAKHRAVDDVAELGFFNFKASWKPTQDGKGRIGIQYFANHVPEVEKSSTINEFLSFLEQYPEQEKETVLVFLTNEDLEKALTDNSKLADYKDQLKTVEYDLIGLLEGDKNGYLADRLVSGLQKRNTFVAIDFIKNPVFKLVNTKMLIRSFLVSTTRQKNYLALIGDPKLSPDFAMTESDDLIESYSGVSGEYSINHKRYLIGDDKEGTGGRYSFLLKGETPLEGEVPGGTPVIKPESVFDKTLRLVGSDRQGAFKTVKTKTSKEIAKLRNNKDVGTRLSEVFFQMASKKKNPSRLSDSELVSIKDNETLEQSERNAAEKILERKKFHKLFNIAVNYMLTQMNNETSPQLKVLEKEAFKIYDFLNDKLLYQYKDKEVLFKSLVRSVAMQPDISIAASNKLALAAPFVTTSIQDKKFVSQLNLLTIVGYTTVENKVIPIVDVHSFKPRDRKDILKADMLHLGGQLAILLNEGFKLNNVTVHNYSVNFKDGAEMKHVARIELTEAQIIDALDKANKHLGIRGSLAQKDNDSGLYDSTAIATEEEFGRQERKLPEHKGIFPGLVFTKGGRVAKVKSLTTKIVNGKRKIFVHVGTEKILFDEFFSSYIKNEVKQNPTYFKSTAEEYSKNNILYGTSMVFMIDNEAINALLPKNKFFEVTGDNKNQLLELRQAILQNFNRNISQFNLVIHKEPITGTSVSSFDDNKVTKNYTLQSGNPFSYPVTIEFAKETTILNLLKKEDVKSKFEAIAKIAGMSLTDNDSRIKAFKAMGMDKLGFLGEVEYRYKTDEFNSTKFDAVKDEALIEKANKYIRTPNLSSEDAKTLLDEIFEDAFPNIEKIDDSDEKANTARNELISMNKARMELLRELWNNKDPKTVRIARVGNGSPIYDRKTDTQGERRLDKHFVVQEVIDNAELYGYNIETKDGKLVLNYVAAGYEKGQKIYAKAWRQSKANPVYILFDGRETVLEDYNDYLIELKQLQESTKEPIKVLNNSTQNTQEFDETFKAITNLIDNSGFFDFLNNNRRTLEELAKTNFEISSRLTFERGRANIAGGVTGKFTKAIALLNYLKNNMGILKIAETEQVVAFYQPIFLNTKNDSESSPRDINTKNIRTAFKGLSQSDLWISYKPDIKLDKAATNWDKASTIPTEQALSELEKILGSHASSNTFLNKGLINRDNKSLFGRLEESMMVLSEIEGRIEKTTHKHEAMHFLMLHLVDQDKANMLLKEAEKQLKKKGTFIREGKVERLIQLHEYLAEKFEKKSITENNILDKFINWLRWVAARITGNKINRFFAEVDRGEYVNQSFHDADFNQALNKRVKNKYNSDESINNLIAIFGSLNAVDNIATTKLANKWFSYSPYGMDFTIIKTNWSDTLKKIMKALELDSIAISDKVVTIHGKDGKVLLSSKTGKLPKVSEMTTKQYDIALVYKRNFDGNIEASDLYERYHLGKGITVGAEIDYSNVAKSIYQRLFKDIDIELLEKGNPDTGIRGKAIFEKANELSNPLDSESSYFKFLLGSIPMYHYGDEGVSLVKDKYVNFKVLDNVLTLMYLNLKMDGSTPSISNVVESMQNIIGIEGKNIVSDPVVKDNIYSFLRHFGYVNDPNSADIFLDKDGILRGIGLIPLIESPEELSDIAENKEQFDEKIIRLKEFVNLIDRYYNSLRHNIISYIDGEDAQMKINILHAITERSIKSGLGDSSDIAMLDDNGDIRGSVIEAFDKMFFMTSKGISKLEDNTKMTIVDVNDFSRTTIDNALLMYEFLGFNAITPEIVALFQRDKAWGKTVEGLYDMMVTAHTAVLMSKDIKESLKKQTAKSKFITWKQSTKASVDKINAKHKRIQDTDQLVDLTTISTYYKEDAIDEAGQILPLPSSHWKYIEETLAKAISFDMSNMVSRTHRKATGTMSYANPLSSWLFDLFPQRTESSRVYGSKIKQNLSLLGTKEKDNNHLVNNKKEGIANIGEYNNPILNNRIIFDFINVFDGMKVVNRAVDFQDMTQFDLIKAIIEGYYLPTLTSTTAITKVPTFSDILSSKSTMPVFNWLGKRGSEKTFLVKSKGGKNPNKLLDLIMDKAFLLDMLFDISRYYEKLSKLEDVIKFPINKDNNPYIAILSILRGRSLKSDTMYPKVREAFLDRFKLFIDVLEENNYVLPENVSNDLNNENWEQGEYIKETGEWHPLLEVVFWSHAVFNESLSHLVRGPQALYGKNESESVIDFIKRASGIIAPGTKYSTNSKWSILPEYSRALVLKDPVVFNELFNGEVEVTDGSSWIMPWYHKALKQESGGDLSTIGNGAIKNVNFSFDPVTLDLIYLKFAQIPITRVHYNSSKYLQQMNTVALGEVGNIEYNGTTWNERFLNNYDKAGKDIFNWLQNEGKEHRDKLIDYIVYDSAYKAGKRKVNGTAGEFHETVLKNPSLSPNLNKDENIMLIPNSTLRHQTVTRQDTEDQFAPIPIQLLFIIGGLSHNNETIRDVNEGLAKIISKANVELMANEDNPNYLHKIGAEYAKNRGMMNKFGELIKNKNIDINIFRDKVFTALSSEMQKHTKPNLPGQSYVQAPWLGTLVEIDGQLYLPSEVKEIEKYTQRGLRPISYKGNEFVPAEIIVPFHNASKFGITRDITLAQSMTVSDNSQSVNLNGKTLEELNTILSGMDIDIIYENMYPSQQEVIEHVNLINLVKYFNTYNEALDVISVRIPTSNASSAFIARIVAFDFDADNTVYVSSEKNIIDGSDYDIDALRLFFRNVSKNLNFDSDDIAISQNFIFQSVVDYYHKVENKPMIIQAITYDNIVAQAKKKMKDRKLYSSDISSMINSFGFTQAGRKLSGHFPNLENFIFRIWALSNEKRNTILDAKYKDQFNDENIVTLSKQIATLINAAVDNEKLGGALGVLNIEEITSPLISGMVFSGLTENESLAILESDEVIMAMKEVKKGINYSSNADSGSNTNRIQKKQLYEVFQTIKIRRHKSPELIEIENHIKEIKDILENTKNEFILLGEKVSTKQVSKYSNFMAKTTIELTLFKEKRKQLKKKEANNKKAISIDELTEYAYIGEALKRLGTIVGLQRELPSDFYEFNSRINQIEFTLGRSLNDFLSNKDVTPITDQLSFINELPGRTKDINHESRIRSIINVQALFNSAEMINFRQLLMVIHNMDNMTNQFTVKENNSLKDIYLKKTGMDGFTYADQYKEFSKSVDSQLIGLFISDQFQDVKLNNESYDLSKIKDRFEFVSKFPKYVKLLQKDNDIEIQRNSFILGLKVAKGFGNNNMPIVQFPNSIHLDTNDYLAYQKSFNELDEDTKESFNAYQLLINGFVYRNGSLIEVLNDSNEKKYSKWFNTFKKTITPGSETYNTLESFIDNIIHIEKNVQTINKGKEGWNFKGAEYGNIEFNRSKPPILVKNVNGNPKYINAIGNSFFNSYALDNNETTYKQYPNITQEQIDKLNNGESLTLRQKAGNKVKPSISNFVTSGIESIFTNTIYSGDVAMLPNGQLARFTTDLGFLVKISLPYVKKSNIIKENSAVAYNFIKPFIKKIQQSFPNIKINLVNNSDVGEDNTVAWIENGEVFFNIDRIQLDTPLHEFIGHILVDLIESTNQGLYSSLYSEALNILDSKNGQLIKEHYSDLSQTDLIREVIANMMGWNSEEKVLSFLMKTNSENAIEESKSYFNKVKGLLKSIRNTIMDWVNRIFGTRLNLKNIETASISDIAKSVIKAIDKGDVITYISSKQYSDIQRMAMYKSRIVKDTIHSLTSLHDMLNDKGRTQKERADHLAAVLRMGNINVFNDHVFGEEVQVNPDDSSAIAEVIRKRDAYASGFTDKIVYEWLDKKGDLMQTQKNVFGVHKRHGTSIFKDMNNFIHHIDFDRATKYYKYSDLKNKEGWAHIYFKDFEGFDPIIAINSSTKDHVDISIYDVTPIPVDHDSDRKNIIKDIKPDNTEVKLMGINLNSTETGIRQLMLALLYNKIMDADKRIVVNNVKFIELTKSKSKAHTIDPVSLHAALKALGTVDEFMDSIANEEIKAIFKNPKYIAKTDYFKTLQSFYEEAPMDKKWDYGLRAALENSNMSPKERYTIFALRLKELMAGRNEENIDQFTNHELAEVKYLNGAIIQVRGNMRMDSQVNPFIGMSKIEMMVFDSNSIGDQRVQELKNIIYTASNTIVELMSREKALLDPLYLEAKKIYGGTNSEWYRSVSQDVWDLLHVKVKDINGNEAETGYIYWTDNENEAKSDMQKLMARQAKKLRIDPKLLAIGRKFTDKIEEYIKKSMLNSKLNSVVAASAWNYDKHRMYKLEDINLEQTMYERGQVPLMTRTPGEQFASGKWEDIVGAAKKKYKLVGDVYELFDNSLFGNIEKSSDQNKLDDMFRYQWGGYSKNLDTEHLTPLGYRGRVEGMLGIKTTVGANQKLQLEIVDHAKNKDISKNLNFVAEAFMISVLRSEQYENHVLPLMNGMKLEIQEMANHENDSDMQQRLLNTIDYINAFTVQGIKEERVKWKSGNIAKVDFDAVAMNLMTLTRPVVMTLNFNIGLIGLVTNNMFAFVEGIANQFVERGIFNAGELTKATGLVMSNPGKVRQLVNMYQVMSMTEQDILRHQTKRIEQKNLFTEFWSSILNWSADYYARSIIMVAQMLHDGSWDAHIFNEDGTIDFDQTKDKRFSTGEEGAQEAMRKLVRDELINDGIWGQEEGKDLVRGYHMRWGRKFKVLADKYVTGAYDNKTKALMGSVILGKMFGYLKSWFVTRYTNAFQENHPIEELGDYKPKKDIHGNWAAQFEALETEGYLTTGFNLIHHLATGNMKNWEMTPTRKVNMIKWATSITMYAAIRAMYAIFVEDGEDDKRKLAVIPDWRIIRNIRYGVASLMVIPTIWEVMLHPFAAIEIAAGWFIDPMGNITTSGNIPFKTQVNTLKEPIESLMLQTNLLNDEEKNNTKNY